MATTTNLGLTKPTVGADDDAWGTIQNTLSDGIDAVFAPTGTAVSLNIGASKSLNLGGSVSSAAWTTAGVKIKQAAATYTDTSSSGTVADTRINNIGAPTLAASSAAVYTNAYGTYFADPVAGTNVTLTNKWALGADSLKVAGLVDISAAAAGQVKFPSSQNASSDANTLDDYEEFTFTPTLTYGGASTGQSLSNVIGKGVKIGKRVFVDISFTNTTRGSSTGAAKIGALPYASQTDANFVLDFFINIANGAQGSAFVYYAELLSNSTDLDIYYRYLTNGSQAAASEADFPNGTTVRLSFSYMANA